MEIDVEPTLHEGTVYGSADEIARLDDLLEARFRGPHLYRERWRVAQVRRLLVDAVETTERCHEIQRVVHAQLTTFPLPLPTTSRGDPFR
jgi:hypothetical protein